MVESTRLIVKNLPSTATEIKLKELFEKKGTVTDVQLKRFDDGRPRHFAFIGFKTPQEADNAREYFHKAFFGASKMQVDICYPLNDPNRPKPRGKQGKQKFEEEKKQKKEKVRKVQGEDEDGESKPKKIKRKEEELLEKAKVDPDFLEFLEVHSKNKAKWGNDTVLDTLEKLVQNKKSDKTKPEKEGKVKAQVEYEGDEDDSEDESEEEDVPAKSKEKLVKGKSKKKKDDDDEVRESKPPPEDTYFTVKLRNLPKKTKKKDLKAFFAPLVPKSIRVPPNLRGFAYVGFVTEAEQKKAMAKNRSMLLGNQIGVKKYLSRATVEKVVQGKTSRWQSQTEELMQQTEGIKESGRIFVRNLAYTVMESDLRTEFEKFGPVTEVHLPVDRITRQTKGFAFVSFLLPEHASKAFEALDGTTFQGRMLHLLPSKVKDEPTADGKHAGSSYKRDKELKMKKTAGSSHNWNSLFLGQNAVSSVASGKYGVSREQLLLDNNDTHDDRVSSVAVRMALAETEIVSETKKFLESQGVCLEAFELGNVKTERSATAMLVKNLVANTSEDELRQVFEKHGVVARVVMPPSGITAIVEFMVPAEARAAFKKLAYTKFKSIPLYLEWAPVDVFRVASDGSKISVKTSPEEKENQKIKETAAEKTTTKKEFKLPNYNDEEPFDENMVPEPGTTLFVKNLNFSCAEDDIKKHFATVGRVYAATIAKKKDPKNPGELLSQGFGFVQYYRAKDAADALSRLNDTMLKNHLLELKMSSRTLQSDTEVDKSAQTMKGTKLLVRNVPFQAAESEITDLFKVFGKLKAVRMPKKTMGESQHRGFAFIDFFVEANAKAAFDTLSKSTHMYGRRLVLEWAQKDASVEELREKVAKQYSRQQSGDSGKDLSSTKKKLKRYFDTESSKRKDVGEQEEDD